MWKHIAFSFVSSNQIFFSNFGDEGEEIRFSRKDQQFRFAVGARMVKKIRAGEPGSGSYLWPVSFAIQSNDRTPITDGLEDTDRFAKGNVETISAVHSLVSLVLFAFKIIVNLIFVPYYLVISVLMWLQGYGYVFSETWVWSWQETSNLSAIQDQGGVRLVFWLVQQQIPSSLQLFCFLFVKLCLF